MTVFIGNLFITVGSAAVLAFAGADIASPQVDHESNAAQQKRYETCLDATFTQYLAERSELEAELEAFEQKLEAAKSTRTTAAELVSVEALEDAVAEAEADAEFARGKLQETVVEMPHQLDFSFGEFSKLHDRCGIFLKESVIQQPELVIAKRTAAFFDGYSLEEQLTALQEITESTAAAFEAEKARLEEERRQREAAEAARRAASSGSSSSGGWRVTLTAYAGGRDCQTVIDQGHYAYCDYGVGVPWFGVHNYVNSMALRVNVGDTVRISGYGFDGTYQAVSTKDIPLGSSSAALIGMGDVVLQTCYFGSNTMRLVGLTRIG